MLHACCQDTNNLKEIERRKVDGGTFIVRQCQVCQRKHYELDVEPIVLATNFDLPPTQQ